MKKYKAILFDADETLLDFKESERHAFYQTAAHWNVHCDESLLEKYSSSNKEAWLLYEKGVISKDDCDKLKGKQKQTNYITRRSK